MGTMFMHSEALPETVLLGLNWLSIRDKNQLKMRREVVDSP
jgi:hypothetical protein